MDADDTAAATPASTGTSASASASTSAYATSAQAQAQASSSADTMGIDVQSISSGASTATTGVGVFTPGQATTGLAQALSSSRTAFTGAAVGNNSASWNPTVVITIPASAVVGTYSGTITHSAA